MPNNNSPYYDIQLGNGQKYQWNEKQFAEGADELYRQFPDVKVFKVANDNPEIEVDDTDQFEVSVSGKTYNWNADQYRSGATLLREQFPDASISRRSDVNLRRDRDFARQYERAKKYAYDGSIPEAERSQYKTFIDENAGRYGEVIGQVGEAPEMEMPPGIIPMENGPQETGATAPRTESVQGAAAGGGSRSGSEQQPLVQGAEPESGEKKSWIRRDFNFNLGSLGTMFNETMRSTARMLTGGIDDTVLKDAREEFERRLSSNEPTFQYNNENEGALLPQDWRKTAAERDQKKHDRAVNRIINAYREEALKKGADPIEYTKEKLSRKSGLPEKIEEKSSELIQENEPSKMGGLAAMGLTTAASIGLAATGNTGAAATVANATLAMFAATGAGASIEQAKQAGATDDQAYAAGIASGVIMYGFTKLPIGKFIKNVTPKAVTSAVGGIVGKAGKGAVTSEMDKLLSDAAKRGIVTPGYAKEYLSQFAGSWGKNIAHSTGSFAAMSGISALVPLIYEDPDEYPVLASVLQSALKGAEDGFIMGAFAGGMSSALEYRNRMNYWKSRGKVTLAEVQPGAGDMLAMYDRKLGKWVPVMEGYTPNGEMHMGEIVGTTGDIPAGETVMGMSNAGVSRQSSAVAVRMDDGNIYVLKPEAVKASRTFKVGKKYDATSGDAEFQEQDFRDAYTDAGYDEGQAAQSSGDPAATSEVSRKVKYMTEKAERERQNTGAVSEETQLDLDRAEQARQGRRDTLRQQMEEKVGQPFYDGNNMVQTARITDADGNEKTVYVVASDAEGYAYIDSEGNKGTVRKDKVISTESMPLDDHLDSLLSEQDKLAEEGRLSAELQNSVNELRSRVQQMAQNGESINVGTPETDVPGIVVGSDDSGVMVQVEGEKTPRVLPWEQVANKLGVSLNPKTDDDLVSGLMARDAKVEEYNTIPRETTLLRNVEGIDQPVKYRFTGAGLDEYGNIVLNATLDATGESAVLYPEDVSNLSEIMTGRSVLSDTEGNPVPVPTEAEQPVATFSDPTANALGIDSKYAVTTKNGNVEVNGSLLWAEDPVMWARWNDANPDKVMSTAEYLNNKLAEIGEESAAVEQALRAEVSGEQRPDVLEDLRQRRQEVTERAGVIENLARQYGEAETDAAQQAVEAVNATAEVPVDATRAKQYAQSTPEQTLTDLRNDPSFTSPEEVAQFIDGKVKRAEKAVSKAQKEADKITADKYDTPAEYRAAKDEKLAAVRPLQQELDHWTAVRNAAMAPAASVVETAPVTEAAAPSPMEVAQSAMDEINSRISPDMPETRRNEAMREKAAAIQRMLDDIGMENTVVTTREDILGRYRKDGASLRNLEELERKLEETKAKGLRFRGFQHLGNVYLLADDLRSATDAVKTQAHEDKHLENRSTRADIDALETGVTDDEMKTAVRKLTRTTMYDSAGSEELADEVIANAAEIAVEYGIDAVPEKLRDAGIKNEEFINFVQKNIKDGRTRSGYLSEGRGYAHGAVSAEVPGGQDGRNPQPQSGNVEEQRLGSVGGSPEGARGEEVQVEQTDRQAISEEGVSSMSQAAIVDGNKPLLSIRTEQDVQNKIREFAKSEEGRSLGWTDEKIEEVISETEDLIDAIHSAVNGDKYYDEWSRRDPTIKVDWRDGVEKPTVTWARANIEYKYDMSADLLCINNEGLEEVLASPVMADLMLAMNRTTKEGFTSDDYLRLYSTLRDMGFVVPCKGCFDAAMRLKMLPSVSRKFVDLVNKTIDERNEDPETFDANLRALAGDESTIGGLPVAAKNKEMAVRIGVAGDNLTEHINWTQLMSAEGQTKALSDWGGIFRAWQRTGAGRPKDKLLPEPWSGDIVSSTTTIIGKYGEKTPSYRDINVNQGTGLRRNSHSEFRPLLAIDEIQFMREAFIRNLTVFKYMKELDDVRLFGNLGVKFNMSFFPAFVEGAPAAGLDKEGNYIAAEESVGGREYEYVGEDGKTHYDGMRGWQEAQKYINKDVSLSSVVFSVPHLIKAFTDVPTARDPRGMWGSLIPFHASGATAGSLKEQGLGSARALGVGHDFETEAYVDYNKGVTNFEAVQNDRFGEGWEVVDGVKAGTAVEPGHKLEFVNGTHYYNKGRGVHLFSSFYILDSELKPEHFDKKGKIIPAKAKADGHAFVVDYNDKVRELGTDTAYQEASDYYINALREIGLVPRFEFQVPEDVFLKMCSEINVDPNHPKLGWKGPGNSWSPTDSEACYSLWCDYGMIDPATGHIAMHNPVGVMKDDGSRVFELPENAIEIIKDGVARYSTRKSREESRTLEAIEEYAKRSVADGKLRQEDVDAILAEARKEDSEFRASVVSDEESQRLFDAAKNLFGTTRDIKEAGYILPDGTMLDFSGKHLLDPKADSSFLRGRRTQDHREIASLAYEKDGNTPTGIETDMPDFIRRGAIRIDGSSGSIDLAVKPTFEQQSVLRRIVDANNGDVYVDFGDGWDTDHSAEYERARADRVINDIRRYFDEGYKPEGNAMFSIVGPEQDAEYMDAVERGDEETQRILVKEAFKRAFPNTQVVDENGEPRVVYHGTKRPFWTFDGGKSKGVYTDGLNYLALDKQFAEDWIDRDDDRQRTPEMNRQLEEARSKKREHEREIVRQIKEKYGEGVSYVDTPEWTEFESVRDQWERDNLGLDGMTLKQAQYDYGKRLLELFVNAENVYNPTERYDSEGKQMLIDLGVMKNPDRMSEYYARGGSYIYYERKAVVDELKRRGYDGILLSENVWSDPSKNLRTLAVWDADRIKLADPVTRDNEGNVIPLSQRFNPDNDDIRYSVRGDEIPTTSDVLDLLDTRESREARKAEEERRAYMNEAEKEEDQVRYSVVTDQVLIDQLESEELVPRYQAVQIVDGKKYPPMAAMIDGKIVDPIPDEAWIRNDEHPELAIPDVYKRGPKKGQQKTYKDGTPKFVFKLDKGFKDARGKKTNVDAAYNPYLHTSDKALNDQFSSAWARPNLGVMRVWVPKSELTSGYRAEKAKDAVGDLEWKNGPVANALAAAGKAPRIVTLTRYAKTDYVLGVDEVADMAAKEFEGVDVEVPFNTVTPALRDALVARGIKIGPPEKGNAGDAARPAYEEWLKGQGDNTRFSVVESDNFKNWFGDWENDPENSSKVVDENGRPAVVYHGSTWNPLEEAPGEAVFDDSYRGTASGDNGFFGPGFYFTYGNGELSKAEARYYGPNVTEAYLNIRNPFLFNETMFEYNGARNAGDEKNSALLVNMVKNFPELVDRLFLETYNGNGELDGEVAIEDYVPLFEDVYKNKEFIVNENVDPTDSNIIEVCADPVTHREDINGREVEWSDYGFRIQMYRPGKNEDARLAFAHYYLTDKQDVGREDHRETIFSIPSNLFNDIFESERFTDALKSRGYDGVMQSAHGDEVVAFYPNQIKSIHNKEFSENDDIRFSFIGEGGVKRLDEAEETSLRMDNLAVAEAMLAENADPQKIKLATGWEKGADGKWRYEIPDIEVKRSIFDIKAGKEVKLSEVIEPGSELLKAYPELGDYTIKRAKLAGAWGEFDQNNKTIRLDLSDMMRYVDELGSANETLLHELQHAIQHLEGFAGGGGNTPNTSTPSIMKAKKERPATYRMLSFFRRNSMQRMRDAGRQKVMEYLNEVYKGTKPGYSDERKAMAAELFRDLYRMNDNQYVDLVRDMAATHQRSKWEQADIYKRLAGEVEARNVESRMKLKPEERRNSLASSTEDVERDRQILRFSVTAEQDAEYMKAVEDGDMDRVQRMVSQAARRAMPETKIVDAEGNPLVVYKREHERHNVMTTEGWGSFYSDKPIEDTSFGDEIGKFYLDFKNPLVVDAEGQNWSYPLYLYISDRDGALIPREDVEKMDGRLGLSKDIWYHIYDDAEEYEFDMLGRLVRNHNLPYDGVVVKNLQEGTGAVQRLTDYIALEPSQIKSADPVTYDDNGNVIPLSQRFNRENDDIRFSVTTEQDAAYMDAIDRGDNETAQRMVEQAAENAMPDSKVRDKNGKLEVMYHGTSGDVYGFTVFNTNPGTQNLGSHFGTEEAARVLDSNGDNTYRVYLDIKNPWVPAMEDFWTNEDQVYARAVVELAEEIGTEEALKIKEDIVKEYPMAESDDALNDWFNEGYEKESTFTGAETLHPRLRTLLEMGGFDGVQYNNWVEDPGHDSWVALYPSQIKSAETVTRDNNGDVVPLSRRFNPENDDIRWSIANQNEETFFSNAERSLDAIKGDAARDAVERVDADGLSSIMGEENRNQLYKDAYKAVPREILSDIVDGAMKSDLNVRGKFNDYLRDLIDGGTENDETGLLRAMINRVRNESGIEDLTDDDIRYMLWRDIEGKRSDSDLVGLARDLARKRRWTEGGPDYSITGTEEFKQAADEAREEHAEANEIAFEEKREKVESFRESLNPIVRAMAAQRRYDKSTIDGLVKFARQLMKAGNVKGLGPMEVNILLADIRSATGKNPAQMTKNADRLMDLIIDRVVKDEEEKFKKLVHTKGKKLSNSGVEVVGTLDKSGLTILKTFRDKMGIPKEELANWIEERETAMSSAATDAEKAEARDEWRGGSLALDYLVEMDRLEGNRRAVEEELGKEDAKPRGERDGELIKALEENLRENRMDMVDVYRNFSARLADIVAGSKERVKEFKEKQAERVEAIHRAANFDLAGISADSENRPKDFKAKLVNNPLMRLANMPLATFHDMLQIFGRRSVDGRGYLFNWLMPEAYEAEGNASRGLIEANDIMDAKVQELFGDEGMRWRDLYKLEDEVMDKIRENTGVNLSLVYKTPQSGQYARPLTVGNALYIYMVDKMSDGRMKLRKMGIEAEHVARLKQVIEDADPRMIQLVDWVQEVFFPDRRNKYNAVHEQIYGTPMAAIEDYVTLRVNKNERYEIKSAEVTGGNGNLTNITGSIIKRRVNTLPIDILHTDAFSLVQEHIQQMEEWAAYAQFREDLKSLLSYKTFQNKASQMTTIYGSGDELFKNFEALCAIVAKQYNKAQSKVDAAAMSLAGGATSSAIAARLWTATKQFASFVTFFADASPAEMVKAMEHWKGSWKWNIENLPLQEKRWRGRNAGYDILDATQDERDILPAVTKARDWFGNWSMIPNAFVDFATTSMGSKATYETKIKQYLDAGFSEEAADRKAKFDAQEAVNTTQQSSSPSHLSELQAQRTFLSSLATMFRNGPFGFTRRYVQAINQAGKYFGGEDKRAQIIDFEKRRAMDDGLNEEQARDYAENKYEKGKWKAVLNMIVMGYLAPLFWNLMGDMPYLAFGDDEKLKKKKLKSDFGKALLGPLEGLLFGGNLVSSFWGLAVENKAIRNSIFASSPMLTDVDNIVRNIGSNNVRALNDLIVLASKTALGVNPQTLTDGVAAVIETFHNDLGAAEEFMFFMMRIMNVPQSQLDDLWIDELQMSGRNARGRSVTELAEIYANYKLNRETPFTNYLYSKDEREERVENKAKTLKSKAKQRKEDNKKKSKK